MSNTILTTSTGAPVADDNNSVSVGPRGPLTFDNHYLFEKLAHFNRERIPERVVHARGTAAYGTFTVTKSLKDFTIANFLQEVGQKTEVFLRFSTVGGARIPAITRVIHVASQSSFIPKRAIGTW
jgi:catalase